MGAGGNGGMKRCKSSISIPSNKLQQHQQQQEEEYFGELEPTNLFLSSSPTGVIPDTAAPGGQPQQQQQQQRLYLPRSGTAPCSLDVYLKSIPAIADRTEELFTKYTSSDAQQQQSTRRRRDDNNNNNNDNQEDEEEAGGVDSILKRAASSQKCLNVLQGEVAHASEDQTDLLVSAEATTCHIVALRSTHNDDNDDGNGGGGADGGALASMAHIDQAGVYEECLEKMVQEHIQHHLEKAKAEMMNETDDDDDFGFFMDDDDEEEDETDHPPEEEPQQQRKPSFLPQPVQERPPTQSTNHRRRQRCRSNSMPSMPTTTKPVEMELHIAGGYLDAEGTSQNLSTSIVHSFSKLADKYQGQIRISLSTAAISSMNTTASTSDDENHGSGGPRSRGLALNTHTGEVIPITSALPSSLDGPAMEIRHARLWGSTDDDPNQQPNPKLAVIHTSTSDGITIDPFHYEAQPQLDALLQVPDPVLLKVTSTSPQHESNRFCNDLRRTLSFVNTIPVEQVFGDGNNMMTKKPLVYSRSSNALNEWQPVR